jgi:hypothetical protein
MTLLTILGALALVAVVAMAVLAVLILVSEARLRKEEEWMERRRANAPGSAPDRSVGP